MSERELRIQAALQRKAAFDAGWTAMTDRAYQVAEMRDFGAAGTPEPSPTPELSGGMEEVGDGAWAEQPYRDGRSGWRTNGDALWSLERRYPDENEAMQRLGFDSPTRTAFLMFGGSYELQTRDYVIERGYKEYLNSDNPLNRFWGVIGLLDRPVAGGFVGKVSAALRMRTAERTLGEIAPVWLEGGYREELGVFAGALPQFMQFLQATRLAMPEGGEH